MSARDVIAKIRFATEEAWVSIDADEVIEALGVAGYVIVPMEPTERMLAAAQEAFGNCWSLEPGEGLDTEPEAPIYRAMLAAAKEP